MATAASPAFNASTANTRLNSLKHGATSKQTFIPGEDPAALRKTSITANPSPNNKRRSSKTPPSPTGIPPASNAPTPKTNSITTPPNPTSSIGTTRIWIVSTNSIVTKPKPSALANLFAFHKENTRTRQWQELHELRKQKFAIQRERFELAKARESRLAAKSQTRESGDANKADSEFRSAKNAVSSPQKTPSNLHNPNQALEQSQIIRLKTVSDVPRCSSAFLYSAVPSGRASLLAAPPVVGLAPGLSFFRAMIKADDGKAKAN
jgi:hypothetical protein